MPFNIKNELRGIDLGDERRDRRIRLLLGRMAADPALSISGACQGWAETMAGYRLVNSKEVTAERVLEPHRKATLERGRACGESLILIQDTTELDYTSHPQLAGIGPLSSIARRGFFLHNRLLVGADSGVALGLCGAEINTRVDSEHGKSKDRKQLPIEEKESMRWMNGYEEACTVAMETGAPQVIMVADRECDIYEIYVRHQELAQRDAVRAEFLVRARVNRQLGKELLFTAVGAAALLGTYEMKITAQRQIKKVRGGSRKTYQRTARKVRMEVRATRVKLPPPYRPAEHLPAVEVTVIEAREMDPPTDQDPIHWVLLSSLPVTSYPDALRLLKMYTQRWSVEEFHRVLKTGCRVEQLSFMKAAAIQPLLAMYMIVAWRILYLRDCSRTVPEVPGGDFFTPEEWKSACIINRRSLERAPPLGELMTMVAVMGGHLQRKNDAPPGAECFWRGLAKLQNYVEMATAMGAV